MFDEEITDVILRCAIEVHKNLGPGLLESAYEVCLCHELSLCKLSLEKQKKLPVCYKGITVDCAYRIDLLIEGRVIVELKTVEKILPVHEAQLLTYLKLTGVKTGLILNFNAPILKDGLRRLVL